MEDTQAVVPKLVLNGSSTASLGETVDVVLFRDPATRSLGLKLQGATPVTVTEVLQDGPADQAGVMVGDTLVKVNNKDVQALEHSEVIRVLQQAGDSVYLTLSREFGTSSTPDSERKTPSDWLAPFDSLHDLVQQPGHMSLFLHHLLSTSTVEDEMLLLLNTSWLCECPSLEQARIVFEDFLATNAPCQVQCVDVDCLSSVEQLLNGSIECTEESIRTVFQAAIATIRPYLDTALDNFRTQLDESDEINGVDVDILRDIPNTSEAAVAYEVLLQHLSAPSPAETQAEAQRQGIVNQTIVSFLERCGASVSNIQQLITASSPKQARKTSGRSKGRKVHLINGHHFVRTTYHTPTFCDVCTSLLWGLCNQGWTCQDCGFNVHKDKDKFGFSQCHQRIQERCPGFKQKKSRFGRGDSKRSSMTKDECPPSPLSAVTSCTSLAPSEQAGSARSSFGSTAGGVDGVPQAIPTSPSLSSSVGSGQEAIELHVPRTSSISSSNRSSFRRSATDSTVSRLSMSALSSLNRHRRQSLSLPDDPSREPQLWCETISDKQVLEAMDTKQIERQELIYELIQTERGYVRQLSIMQKILRNPLEDAGIVSPEDLAILFGDLDEVLRANSTLHRTLSTILKENRGRPIKRIGEQLLKGVSAIDPSPYARFCERQKEAQALYDSLMTNDSNFAAQMKLQESNPLCDRLSYKDFVAKPLQRLTKYPLLLKGIRKLTGKTDADDIPALQRAVDVAEKLLQFVQTSVRTKQDRQRIKDLQARLVTSQLPPEQEIFLHNLHISGYELLREQELKLRHDRKTYDVHCILFSTMLVVCVPRDGKLVVKMPYKDTRCTPIVPLTSAMVRPVAYDGQAFFVIRSCEKTRDAHMYEFVANTRTSAVEWRKLVSSTAEEIKRRDPAWESKVLSLLDAADAASASSADDDGSFATNLPIEAVLGEVIEKMRENCEQNRELLEQVRGRLEEEGYQLSCGESDFDLQDDVGDLSVFSDNSSRPSAGAIMDDEAGDSEAAESCSALDDSFDNGLEATSSQEGKVKNKRLFRAKSALRRLASREASRTASDQDLSSAPASDDEVADGSRRNTLQRGRQRTIRSKRLRKRQLERHAEGRDSISSQSSKTTDVVPLRHLIGLQHQIAALRADNSRLTTQLAELQSRLAIPARLRMSESSCGTSRRGSGYVGRGSMTTPLVTEDTGRIIKDRPATRSSGDRILHTGSPSALYRRPIGRSSETFI